MPPPPPRKHLQGPNNCKTVVQAQYIFLYIYIYIYIYRYRYRHIYRFEEYSDNVKSQPRPETPDDITSESEQEDLYGSECYSEFDEWKEFDETNESAALTDEDRLQELEEILIDENYAELWESRLYFFFPLLNFNNMEYLGSNVLSDEDLDNI